MTIYPQLIIDALKTVRYPGTGKDIVEMGMVEDNIRIDGMNVTFSLLFDKPNDPFIRSVVKAAETAILTYISPEVNIKNNITVKAKQLARPEPDKLLPQVKNIIAVSSGKGGVGKARWQPIWLWLWLSWATSRLVRCRYLRSFPT